MLNQLNSHTSTTAAPTGAESSGRGWFYATCWSSRCAASPRLRYRVSALAHPGSQRSIWRQEGRRRSSIARCGRSRPRTAATFPVTHAPGWKSLFCEWRTESHLQRHYLDRQQPGQVDLSDGFGRHLALHAASLRLDFIDFIRRSHQVEGVVVL